MTSGENDFLRLERAFQEEVSTLEAQVEGDAGGEQLRLNLILRPKTARAGSEARK